MCVPLCPGTRAGAGDRPRAPLETLVCTCVRPALSRTCTHVLCPLTPLLLAHTTPYAGTVIHTGNTVRPGPDAQLHTGTHSHTYVHTWHTPLHIYTLHMEHTAPYTRTPKYLHIHGHMQASVHVGVHMRRSVRITTHIYTLLHASVHTHTCLLYSSRVTHARHTCQTHGHTQPRVYT